MSLNGDRIFSFGGYDGEEFLSELLAADAEWPAVAREASAFASAAQDMLDAEDGGDSSGDGGSEGAGSEDEQPLGDDASGGAAGGEGGHEHLNGANDQRSTRGEARSSDPPDEERSSKSETRDDQE